MSALRRGVGGAAACTRHVASSLAASRRFAATPAAAASSGQDTALLVSRGKVASFVTSREGADGTLGIVKSTTGYSTGERLRSYAGARVGQLCTVVGLRGGALWVVWDEDSEPTGLAVRDLPRLDLRVITRVEFSGLDKAQHSEGEPFYAPAFTEEDAERESRVRVVLDDASLQHLASEAPVERRCERCTEAHELTGIVNAVKALAEPAALTSRLTRLLLSRTSNLPSLRSARLLNKEVQHVMDTTPSVSTPADALEQILAERVAQLDTLVSVRVLGNDYGIPAGVVETSTANFTLVNEPWAKVIPGVSPTAVWEPADGAAAAPPASPASLLFEEESEQRDVHAVALRLADLILSGGAADVKVETARADSVLDEATAASLGVSETGLQWLRVAVLSVMSHTPGLAEEGRKTVETLQGFLKAAAAPRGGGRAEVGALVHSLLQRELERVGACAPMREKGAGDGAAVRLLPKVALEAATGEVYVKDEEWVRDAVLSHPSIGSAMRLAAQQAQTTEEGEGEGEGDDQRGDRGADGMIGCFGKHGMIQGKPTNRMGVLSPSIAPRLLHVCFVFFFSFFFACCGARVHGC